MAGSIGNDMLVNDGLHWQYPGCPRFMVGIEPVSISNLIPCDQP
jgi:hypothetical protein